MTKSNTLFLRLLSTINHCMICFCTICFCAISNWAAAGSGLYYGIDVASHELTSATEVTQTFTPAPPAPTFVTDSLSERDSDFSLRGGLKHKRRLTHDFYLAPEFVVSRLEDELLYSTNLKFGYDIDNVSVFVIAGLSHIDAFDKNQLNYGIGCEINLSHRSALNFEWQRFDTMEENTSAETSFGSQTSITTTATERDLDALKIGLTIYIN